MPWPQRVPFPEWSPAQFLGTNTWGMVEKGEGGARTCSLEEEAGRALRRTLSSHEEEEEPAESGGC